jgi:hypothetical protein
MAASSQEVVSMVSTMSWVSGLALLLVAGAAGATPMAWAPSGRHSASVGGGGQRVGSLVAAGDLDGDGRDDLIVAGASTGDVIVLLCRTLPRHLDLAAEAADVTIAPARLTSGAPCSRSRATPPSSSCVR